LALREHRFERKNFWAMNWSGSNIATSIPLMPLSPRPDLLKEAGNPSVDNRFRGQRGAASPGRRGHRREDPKAREEGTVHQVAKHGRTDGPWFWDLLPKKSTCQREVGHLPNVRVNTLLLDFFDHGQHGPSLNTPTLCPPSQMRAVFPPTARTSPLPWPTFSATGAACFP
jgi:hypothetical protein